MNINDKSIVDFEVLGHKIKLGGQASDISVSPEVIVNIVNKKASELKDKLPSLSKDELLVLVSLELAKERVELENEYKTSIEELHIQAGSALSTIEDIIPNTPQ